MAFILSQSNMISADLHMHSSYSNDGELSVAQLIKRCTEKGANFFSITDHNSARANKEAIELVSHTGLDYIPGIEIDCIYKGINLHVLGYKIDWKNITFLELEEDVSSKVMQSFDQMIDNIRSIGFKIDKKAVLDTANGILPSAELIAEVMLSDRKYYTSLLDAYLPGGERGDMPYINFYLDYFAQGKHAFVPVDYISFDEAINLIRATGGIPIVAHPGLNLKGCEDIASELLDKGAEGLEVFNNYHTDEQVKYFSDLVKETGKLMTCGSDFHGKTKPLIEIRTFKYREEDDAYLRKSIQEIYGG